MDEIQLNNILNNNALSLKEFPMDNNHIIKKFTEEIQGKKINALNIELISPEKFNELSKQQIDSLKETLHFEMCQKLAVLGNDLLQNQAITRDIISSLAKGNK